MRFQIFQSVFCNPQQCDSPQRETKNRSKVLSIDGRSGNQSIMSFYGKLTKEALESRRR